MKFVNAVISPKRKEKIWEGHRYGGQCIKPSVEPIIVFQKPYDGKPLDSIVEHGAGAINIEQSRIGTGSRPKRGGFDKDNDGMFQMGSGNAQGETTKGRWPANLAITHNLGCVRVGECDGDTYQINRFTDGAKPFGGGAGHEYKSESMDGGKRAIYDCEPNCPVAMLDAQSGVLKSGLLTPDHKARDWGYHGGARDKPTLRNTPADKGGASRFFHNSDYALENAEPIRYQAKASRKERNAGLDNFSPATRGDGRQKSIDNAYQRGETPRRNTHPTLKPIALTRWLATLLLPPDEYAPRRLLIPFCGSGSEMIGAHQAGWDECLGIELMVEYAEIAEARLAYWIAQAEQMEMFK